MLTCTRRIAAFLIVIFGLSAGYCFASTPDSITLYTPYTKISVPPGESVEYAIDVINNGSRLQNVDLVISGLPKDWTYTLKSGGWTVSQMAVMPGERKSFSLRVSVPLKVSKGNYGFRVSTRKFGSLPLFINVSREGTFKTEFSSDLMNMQGNAGSTFTFNASLKNQTAEKQVYALNASVAEGWNATFKAKYKQVTSVEIEAGSTENITIEITPPEQIEARTYDIPVRAYTSSTSAGMNLQVVVTGSYALELTTPTGLLSTDIVAGETKRIELTVKNTGSSNLNTIKFNANAPAKWEVTFDPATVAVLNPGSQTTVYAVVKADRKAIPGDYATTFNATVSEKSSKASFRISVKTSWLTGWFGVLIILVAVGIIYFLFRKYGRR